MHQESRRLTLVTGAGKHGTRPEIKACESHHATEQEHYSANEISITVPTIDERHPCHKLLAQEEGYRHYRSHTQEVSFIVPVCPQKHHAETFPVKLSHLSILLSSLCFIPVI